MVVRVVNTGRHNVTGNLGECGRVREREVLTSKDDCTESAHDVRVLGWSSLFSWFTLATAEHRLDAGRERRPGLGWGVSGAYKREAGGRAAAGGRRRDATRLARRDKEGGVEETEGTSARSRADRCG